MEEGREQRLRCAGKKPGGTVSAKVIKLERGVLEREQSEERGT